MYWDTEGHHNLAHNPFTALVVPRPIGWISTYGARGRPNIAPYSFFNIVSYAPYQLILSIGPRLNGQPAKKDTLRNIEETGCFVANLVTWDLRDAMNATAVECPPHVDEFELAGITPEPARCVNAPRVRESPVNMECELVKLIETRGRDERQPNILVLGEVRGIHIDDSIIEDGMVAYGRMKPIARLGYLGDYAATTDLFQMPRPSLP